MQIAKSENKRTIKVVSNTNKKRAISKSDAEMDTRAVQAVRAAIEKAKVCKKPIAKYDPVNKAAYIEYENGVRKYVK